MRLTRYLDSDLVFTGLTGRDVKAVLREISSRMAAQLDTISQEELEAALVEREEVHTTTLGRGVAIPHATLRGPEDPVLMVARADEPVQFGPPDTDPVLFFFVLVSPPGREREHIKLLARICRLVRVPEFMDELREAKDAREILSIIERTDGEHV
ncbi:MAG: PTS sugar transporter subunit IIA [Longimicrobiales bacterium]|nr:PTS sugar transporter subunit IIA [Longimicrobiales bacterium]